jgi:hypothetical protein
MTWTVKADVYLAELAASNELVRQGKLVAPVVTFATNDLTIMVPAGNPARITGLADLGRADLELAMPNADFQRVGQKSRQKRLKSAWALCCLGERPSFRWTTSPTTSPASFYAR